MSEFEVSLADKGDLLVRAMSTRRENGADLAEGQYQIWDTAPCVPPERPR